MTDNLEAPWVGNPPYDGGNTKVYECEACGEPINAGDTYYEIPVEGKHEKLCDECFKDYVKFELKRIAY